jgi:hypothetical protein
LISYELYLLLATAAFGIGFFLLTHGVLRMLAGLLSGFWDWLIRKLRPGARRMQQLAKEARAPSYFPEKAQQSIVTVAALGVFRYPWPVLGGLVLAVLAKDWMFSPLMVLAGAVVSTALFTRMRRALYNRLTDELEMLILQFVSRYPLRNSVATALAESAEQIPKGMLSAAAANTATRLKLGEGDRPFRDMIEIPHPIARRFAGVLMRAGYAAPEVFLDLLNQLRKDTEGRRELAQRVRRDLTLESATITVLQVVLVLSLVGVALLPSWRNYYTGTLANRIFYLAMVGMGVVGTVIGDNEIRSLEES